MPASTAIVILNWNSRDMTAECIRSLLAMDCKDYHIIVVDNGSHDGSPEYLRQQFPRITLLPQQRNLGFALGCNIGMRHALENGFDYVLPLNNDTVVDPHFLSALLEAAERHPAAGLLSPKIYFYDFPDRFWWAGGQYSLWTGITKHFGWKQKDIGQFDCACPIDWATACAPFLHASALRKVGLFDENFFLVAEDLDLSLRLRRAGYEIWYTPQAKLWHKTGVDTRRNAMAPASTLCGTRNLLWIAHRYASASQLVTLWPNFLLRYAGYYIALNIIRGDFRSAWSVVQGIAAFGAMRVPPGVRTAALEEVRTQKAN
jgi:GT2 family glycosyltransferase